MAEQTPAKPTRWNPFRDELALPDLLRDWPFGRLNRRMEEPGGMRHGVLSPAVDLSEDERCFTVTAELPGVKKEEVTVELQDDVLTIRGEKKSEREEKKGKSHWIERSYGSFSRSFSLPPSAQAEEMKASFKDGVLTVEIPKREQAKTRQIAIK